MFSRYIQMRVSYLMLIRQRALFSPSENTSALGLIWEFFRETNKLEKRKIQSCSFKQKLCRWVLWISLPKVVLPIFPIVIQARLFSKHWLWNELTLYSPFHNFVVYVFLCIEQHHLIYCIRKASHLSSRMNQFAFDWMCRDNESDWNRGRLWS